MMAGFSSSLMKRVLNFDYQAECHTPEYHIGIDLIKPCQNPVRMRYSGVWHSAGNRLNTMPHSMLRVQ